MCSENSTLPKNQNKRRCQMVKTGKCAYGFSYFSYLLKKEK